MDSAMKRPRGRPKSVDRSAATQAAMENYWRLGLSALSLNEVCRRAGISKPALYREFGGEDGLLAAALDNYRERFVLPLLSLFAADRSMDATLEAAVVATTTDRGTPAGCLFTKMRLVDSRLGPVATEHLQRLEQERWKAFEAWYQRGLDRGEANPDLTAEFAARYLDTQITAILVQMGNEAPVELVRDQARLALASLKSS